MVLDYRRLATASRPARRNRAGDDEPLNEHGAVLAMQASAGNRATRAAIADVRAQRSVTGGPAAPRSVGAGGELVLGGQKFSILTAEWSQDAKVTAVQQGERRGPDLVPVSSTPGRS